MAFRVPTTLPDAVPPPNRTRGPDQRRSLAGAVFLHSLGAESGAAPKIPFVLSAHAPCPPPPVRVKLVILAGLVASFLNGASTEITLRCVHYQRVDPSLHLR
jgi:hypothetical protein